jgi:hypothetical protein
MTASVYCATEARMFGALVLRCWLLVHRRRVLTAAKRAAYWGTSVMAMDRRAITDGSAPGLSVRAAFVMTKRSAQSQAIAVSATTACRRLPHHSATANE